MSSECLPLDFSSLDFAAYCPVCDREIAGTTPAEEIVPIPSPALSATAKGKRPASSLKRSESSTTNAPRRNKSSTKIHSSISSKGHARTKSQVAHTSALTASTPFVAPLPPDEAVVAPAEASTSFNPPSSLYCSEDCRRIDELRSRLAFANLGSASSVTLARQRTDEGRYQSSQRAEEISVSMSRRRSSGMSQRSNNSSDHFTHLPYPAPVESMPSLDFSTRRSSRGSEGGYSYRPNRGRSIAEDSAVSYSYCHSRGSNDSLSSIGGDGDERDRAGSFGRPQSALSSLRFMTPISSPIPPSRPQQLVRANTDFSPRTAAEQQLPGPRALEGSRSESDPGGLRRYSPIATSPGLVSSQSTTEAFSIVSSYNTTPRNPTRSLSSASLALMSTSLSRSHASDSGWGRPKRTASTASLSGLIAVGYMASTQAEEIPRRRREHGRASASPILNNVSTSPATSSASNSSYAHSHSSARSTAGSSDYHPHPQSPPSSSSHRSTSKHSRVRGGLLMTPSASSISSNSYEPPTFLAALTKDRAELEKRHVEQLTWDDEKTPTQSLAKGEEVDRTVRRTMQQNGLILRTERRLSTNSTLRRPRGVSPSPLVAGETSMQRHPSSPNMAKTNPTLAHLDQVHPEHRKNWSWDHLPGVPTYTALDVGRKSDGANGVRSGRTERKRLFYFSDADGVE